MVHGDAFLALCAISSYSSWVKLKLLREKVISEKDGDTSVPIVVVANKQVSDACGLVKSRTYNTFRIWKIQDKYQ